MLREEKMYSMYFMSSRQCSGFNFFCQCQCIQSVKQEAESKKYENQD